MIQLKTSFYNKIGNINDNRAITYKFIFGSVDPHFYFAGYVVPGKDSYDMYYVPYVNNFYDNNIIDMSDIAVNKLLNISYGESAAITLANDRLVGFGRFVDVSISIDEKPSSVNVQEVSEPDIAAAHAFIKEETVAIDNIELYTLRNILSVEVEAKIRNIMSTALGVEQKPAIRSIIKSILTKRSIFYSALPETLSQARQDVMYSLYSRLSSIDPSSSNISDIFAVSIEFARIVDKEDIAIENIPYNILFRLASGWTKDKNAEHITFMKTSALAVPKTEEITINMSTMEDLNTVYAILSKTQSFVYLTGIEIENIETGQKYIGDIDNLFYKNFVKNTDACIEVKGIPTSNGAVFIQYGYGTSCDAFVGIYARSATGRRYGFRREDKINNDELSVSRIWDWEGDHLEKFNGEIDDANSITVTFKGV